MTTQLALVDVPVARASGRCRRCMRVLHDPASVERGYGPVCAEKEGLKPAAMIDALDRAFEVAWNASPDFLGGDRETARRWYRSGVAQAKPANDPNPETPARKDPS